MDSLTSPSPEAVDTLVQQAIAEQRSGRAERATRLYRLVLDASPGHPEASHNLAILLLQAGDLAGALEHFRTALENDADRELYWLSYARALLLAQRTAEAAAVLKQGEAHVVSADAVQSLLGPATAMFGVDAAHAGSTQTASLAGLQASALARRGDFEGAARRLRNAIAQSPTNSDQLLLQLGDILAQSGATSDAIAAFEQALTRNPTLAEAHHHLGSVLSENNQVAKGFAHLMRHAELVHSDNACSDACEAAHKNKHDCEQAAYLAATAAIPATGTRLPFHIGNGSRIAGAAISPDSAGPDLQDRWAAATPKFLVIDNFLTPEALQNLRDYCADSTIWKRVYDAGYIGATPADGFACPLLAQMVEEMQDVYRPILGAHLFRYLGAFKYDSELSSGTNTHADFSAVNVNLYIAPDTANLAPDRGGMVLWDLHAESESDLRFYNSDEPALRRRIETSRAAMYRIPHRANRAVIFESSLFHRTDDCEFREGYLNKRINVSFLYGDWQSGQPRG